MHALRKNRHWVSGFLLPILMVIWLSVTCQACFASEQPVAMNGHDCCPGMKVKQDQDAHQHALQHQGAKVCKTSCTIHSSQKQDIHDGFSLEKLTPVLAPVSDALAARLLARHSPGIPVQRVEPAYFPPAFESYRILLI